MSNRSAITQAFSSAARATLSGRARIKADSVLWPIYAIYHTSYLFSHGSVCPSAKFHKITNPAQIQQLSHVLAALVPSQVCLFDLITKEQINKMLPPENSKLCLPNKHIHSVARKRGTAADREFTWSDGMGLKLKCNNEGETPVLGRETPQGNSNHRITECAWLSYPSYDILLSHQQLSFQSISTDH